MVQKHGALLQERVHTLFMKSCLRIKVSTQNAFVNCELGRYTELGMSSKGEFNDIAFCRCLDKKVPNYSSFIQDIKKSKVIVYTRNTYTFHCYTHGNFL